MSMTYGMELIPFLERVAHMRGVPLMFRRDPTTLDLIAHHAEVGWDVGRWPETMLIAIMCLENGRLASLIDACEPTSLQILTYAQLTGPHVGEEVA